VEGHVFQELGVRLPRVGTCREENGRKGAVWVTRSWGEDIRVYGR
jgi:hypothetical protein